MDWSLLVILLTTFLSNTIYGLASPFLPTLLEEVGVASLWTGIIFASYAVAMSIVSPIVGKVLNKVSHSKVMAMGCFLMALSCASFGFVKYVDGKKWIITSAIALRILQGKQALP